MLFILNQSISIDVLKAKPGVQFWKSLFLWVLNSEWANLSWKRSFKSLAYVTCVASTTCLNFNFFSFRKLLSMCELSDWCRGIMGCLSAFCCRAVFKNSYSTAESFSLSCFFRLILNQFFSAWFCPALVTMRLFSPIFLLICNSGV